MLQPSLCTFIFLLLVCTTKYHTISQNIYYDILRHTFRADFKYLTKITLVESDSVGKSQFLVINLIQLKWLQD